MARDSDPRIKVKWANQNIENLTGRIDDFIESAPYEIIENGETQPGEQQYTVRFIRQLPTDIQCLTGDILHNLRSALDHLLFSIMPSDVTWERFHCFPICRDSDEYEAQKRWKRSKIKGLPATLVQRIDAMKPYHGGNDALWRLHELNNIDKHRLLLTLGLAQHKTWVNRRLAFLGGLPWWPMVRRHSQTIPVDDGAIIVPPTGPSDMNVNDKYSVVVALNEPQIVAPQPVIPTLLQFSNLVEGVIGVFDDIA